MKNRSIALSVCLAACLSVLPVQAAFADMIFDNGDPTWGYGVSILSELDTFNQVGDDFFLDEDVVLGSVDWWGSASGNNFRVRIFAFNGSVPEATPLLDLDVGVLTGEVETFSGGPRQKYHASIPGLPLGAGRYLLSIVDQSATETWFWDASCEDGCETFSWRRPLDGDDWNPGNFSMSFRLHGELAVVSDTADALLPHGLNLRNVPNPFNPTTTIRFELAHAGNVRLDVLDAQGRVVRKLLDRPFEAGFHSVVWDGSSTTSSSLASGVYLYRLETAGTATTRKMLLLK